MIGTSPANKARVSVPKAKPFTPGSMRPKAPSVTGMVILKRKTAETPAAGFPASRNSNAAAPSVTQEDRTAPNRSARKPPAVFPKTTAQVLIKAHWPTDFHGKAILEPAKDRRHTTRKIQRAAKITWESPIPSKETGTFRDDLRSPYRDAVSRISPATMKRAVTTM